TFHKKSPNDSSIVNVCFSLNNKHVCLKSMTIFSGDSTFIIKPNNDSSIVNVCFSLNNKHVCLKSMTIFSGDSTFIIKPNYEFPENSTVKKLEDIIYNN